MDDKGLFDVETLNSSHSGQELTVKRVFKLKPFHVNVRENEANFFLQIVFYFMRLLGNNVNAVIAFIIKAQHTPYQ